MKKYITTFALVLLAAVTMFLAEPSEAQAKTVYYRIKSFEVSSLKCEDGKMTIKFDKENGIFKSDGRNSKYIHKDSITFNTYKKIKWQLDEYENTKDHFLKKASFNKMVSLIKSERSSYLKVLSENNKKPSKKGEATYYKYLSKNNKPYYEIVFSVKNGKVKRMYADCRY